MDDGRKILDIVVDESRYVFIAERELSNSPMFIPLKNIDAVSSTNAHRIAVTMGGVEYLSINHYQNTDEADAAAYQLSLII